MQYWHVLIQEGETNWLHTENKREQEAKMNGISYIRKPKSETLTKKELIEVIYTMLLRRKGEVMTEDLARERANNITTALAGMEIEL